MEYKRIGVMCGSSSVCDKKYLDSAFQIGELLGQSGRRVVYGGGAKGLMANVANGALTVGGEVHGYIPDFMIEVEWQHTGLTQLHITKDMAERKFLMMNESDATIFLPGGCGTMEEFFEWLSAKRLAKYLGPLVIFNFEGYYDPLIELLIRMEKERFHNPIHSQMWSVCEHISQLIPSIEQAPKWSKDALAEAAAK